MMFLITLILHRVVLCKFFYGTGVTGVNEGCW